MLLKTNIHIHFSKPTLGKKCKDTETLMHHLQKMFNKYTIEFSEWDDGFYCIFAKLLLNIITIYDKQTNKLICIPLWDWVFFMLIGYSDSISREEGVPVFCPFSHWGLILVLLLSIYVTSSKYHFLAMLIVVYWHFFQFCFWLMIFR